MAEDFGYFGDETLLEPNQFALELNELHAMDWQERQEVLDELADEEEDEPVIIEQEDCPLDGDAESALASCGWGDKDYGCYGGDDW